MSSDWVITGQGEKFVVHHTGSSAEAGAYEKDVRLREMLNLQPVPPPRTDHLPNMVLRDPSAEYSKGKWLHARTKGAAFGYAALTDSRDVRLKALTKDSEIEGTHLQRLAKDDAVWDRVGGMYGWEFEEMRHYFSTVGDRSVELWMHFLHFMRVSAGYTVAASADVKGQKGLKGRKG